MSDYVKVVYDENKRPLTSYPQQLVEYLVNRFSIKNNGKILDVGCGRGDILKSFSNLGFKSYGLDISEHSKKILPEFDISVVNLENGKLPYEDNFFDCIFSKCVIEHIYNPDNFIKECYRVLKPNGRIILMTPEFNTNFRIFYDAFTHIHPYTVNSLNEMLNIYDFKNVECEDFYQLPIVWKYPQIKIVCKILQLAGPVKKIHKNKFYRWSKELMVLGSAIKR